MTIQHSLFRFRSQRPTTFLLRGVHVFSNTSTAITAKLPINNWKPSTTRQPNLRRAYLISPYSKNVTSITSIPTKLKPPPKIAIFHNPLSALSVTVLSVLRDAQLAYPKTKTKTGPPLDLDLTVLERLPTAEELQDIYSLLNKSSWTSFLNPSLAHGGGYRVHPTSARSLLEALEILRQEERIKAKERPPNDSPLTDSEKGDVNHPLFGTDAFSWPIVVCWRAREVAVGGPKRLHKMLRNFANDRDGVIARNEKMIKAEEEKSQRARWHDAPKEVSPEEEDTLEWFKETSTRSTRKGDSW